DHADARGIDLRARREQIVGGDDIREVLCARDGVALRARACVTAQIERQAHQPSRLEPLADAEIAALRVAPAVDEQHRGAARLARRGQQQLAVDELRLDVDRDVVHRSRLDVPRTRLYRSTGPASRSIPWKCTTAPSGGAASAPYASTEDARTTSTDGSRANVSSAATSAGVAPPTRHEASKTPERERPLPSTPCPTS